jgi:hypothetical protein
LWLWPQITNLISHTAPQQNNNGIRSYSCLSCLSWHACQSQRKQNNTQVSHESQDDNQLEWSHHSVAQTSLSFSTFPFFVLSHSHLLCPAEEATLQGRTGMVLLDDIYAFLKKEGQHGHIEAIKAIVKRAKCKTTEIYVPSKELEKLCIDVVVVSEEEKTAKAVRVFLLFPSFLFHSPIPPSFRPFLISSFPFFTLVG